MNKRCAVLILGVMAVSSRAAAQGFIIPELGTRVNGMGAAVGRPDDLSAIYHNPAALTRLPGTQLMVGFGAAVLDIEVRLRPWDGTEPYLTDPLDSAGYFPAQRQTVFAPIPVLAASTNLFSDKLVVAGGIYVPNAAGASFGETAPSRYHIIDAHVFSAFFTGAVAYQPWRWLSVGVGASAVYINIHRRSLLFPVVDSRDLSGIIGGNTEMTIDGEDVKPAFHLGIQAWPHRTLSLGLMVLSRYDVSLEGPLRLKPGADASPLVQKPAFTENKHRTEIVSPWVFGFGANWDVTPWLELGAEFRYYLTSEVENQVTSITEGTVLRTLLSQGFVTPKNLNDTIHTGGGAIVRPPLDLDLELMAGVHYENGSSPNNTVEVSAPSFSMVALHTGARWSINERFRLALLYSHYWYFERDVTDSITSPPTNFIGSGSNNQVTLVLEVRFAPGIGVSR